MLYPEARPDAVGIEHVAREPALLASTREGELVFDPFTGSGTIAVAAKELNRTFVGAELEEGYAKLAARRIRATKRGSLLREISERFWNAD